MGNRFLVYVGTYTARGSEGIYLCGFDGASGTLAPPVAVASLPNPTFQAVHPRMPFLYSVSEQRDARGRHDGAVNAFARDPGSGRLSFANKQPSHGVGPCHVAVDRQGRFVIVANYESGSVAIFPVREDGGLGEAADVVQHYGSSVNPDRQAGPHAHSVTVSPDNRFVLAADLGLDRMMIYRLDGEQGKLVPHDPPWSAARPGSGPRHFAFHPAGRFAYLVHELDSTITAFSWDAARGVLHEIQTLSALPPGLASPSYCADVHVAPSGRFVYASNRGHDSIAIFRIDPATGALSVVGYEPTRGAWPRNFAIDPTGAYLLAANQDGDSIVVFRIVAGTGALTPTGQTANLSMPVCLTMVARS